METVTSQLLSLAVMALTIVQVIKGALRLDREWPKQRERLRRPLLLFLSVCIGTVCALGTLSANTNPLPNFPTMPVQVVLGIIAGLMASGGWDAIKQLQDRGIARRAELPTPETPQVNMNLPQNATATVVVQVPTTGAEPEPQKPTATFDVMPGFEPVDPNNPD